MKIKEAAQIVGMTKKNIRFYEEQGLLSPGRNSENGYRDYGEADLERLRQIKLFRKLGLPMEEIKAMQDGRATVADSMKRHLVSLARKRRNLDCADDLCSMLAAEDVSLSQLDTGRFLQRMESLESAGNSFSNAHASDVRPKGYIGAVIATAAITALMSVVFFLIIWEYRTSPEEAPPFFIILLLLALPLAVVGGVCFSLIQRIGEIKRGEFLDAKKF